MDRAIFFSQRKRHLLLCLKYFLVAMSSPQKDPHNKTSLTVLKKKLESLTQSLITLEQRQSKVEEQISEMLLTWSEEAEDDESSSSQTLSSSSDTLPSSPLQRSYQRPTIAKKPYSGLSRQNAFCFTDPRDSEKAPSLQNYFRKPITNQVENGLMGMKVKEKSSSTTLQDLTCAVETLSDSSMSNPSQ